MIDGKIFTWYQTNERMDRGGYMTYWTLDAAMKALKPHRGINTIYATTYVVSEWWHGKKMTNFKEILSSGVIYKI